MKNIKKNINKEIKSKSIKIVTAEGLSENYTLTEALKIANDEGLDLVEMSTNEDTSICKIMDYNKHLYEVTKKIKQIKNKNDIVKEIKFNNNIADHDLKIKAKKAEEILNQGYKVKIAVNYKGRERSRITEGKSILEKCLVYINNNIETTITKNPKIEGSSYNLIVEKLKGANK